MQAVSDVSFALSEGETLGVVGESGCGKTTLIRGLVRLLDTTGGSIRYRGRDITKEGRRGMQPIRREMQMVFQDPQASLNPRKRVGQILATPLRLRGVPAGEIERETRALLARVGLSPEHLNRFPHEFSGGQRQRIGIARALAMQPRVIMLDEPVSALDVSIQAQVVNLLDDLQDELGLSFVFVAHDLSVVRHVSDRIGVMYLGKLVELSASQELYEKPIHPYTSALLGAIPIPTRVRTVSGRARCEGEPRTRSRRRRLPLPHALPARERNLPHLRATAHRVRERPPRGLPPPAGRHRRGDRGLDPLPSEPVERRRGATGQQPPARPAGRLSSRAYCSQRPGA